MKYLPTHSFKTLITALFIGSLFVIAASCDSGSSDTGTSSASAPLESDLADLVLEDIPGSEIKYARQISADGQTEIQGFVLNGKRTGQWIQYTPEGDLALINNYVDGMLEGPAFRMSFRNQVDLKTTFHKNQLHGPWTAYKYGKVIELRNYVNGKLDGVTKTFDDRTFSLKQEVEYKNGLQHGYFRYYDEEGNVTLEYLYEEGEKISGGIVE